MKISLCNVSSGNHNIHGNIKKKSKVIVLQGFWVWAQPMREGVTKSLNTYYPWIQHGNNKQHISFLIMYFYIFSLLLYQIPPYIRCYCIDMWWRHCGLVTPYGDIDIGKFVVQVMACCLTAPSHYMKQCWFLVCRDCNIHLRSILQRVRKLFYIMSLNLVPLKLFWHLPGASELISLKMIVIDHQMCLESML